MRNRKLSIILIITVSLVLVGSFCFIASAVPPEGKGKKVSDKPIVVYDGNGDYIGQLVSIFFEPFERITVLVPSIGKFMEIQGTLNGYAPITLLWYDEASQNFEDYIPGVTPPDVPLYETGAVSPTRLHFLLSFYDYDHYRHFTRDSDGWLTDVTLDFSYPI
jgi:hypothetical protein